MTTVPSRVRTTAVLLIALSVAPAVGANPPVTVAVTAAGATPSTPAPTAEPQAPGDVGFGTIVRDIVGDFAHLPSLANLAPTIVGGVGALAAHTVDGDVNSHLYGRGGVHAFFLPGKTIGQAPVQVSVGILVYAIGRSTDRPRATHIGMDLLRADALAGALTLALKETVRRQRPNGTSRASFPSGHASMTFATASVLARHFDWRVAVPTYLLAAYVASSRLHENVHYLSDVVAGGTIGYLAGRTATRHGRSNFAVVPVLGQGTSAVMVSRTW